MNTSKPTDDPHVQRVMVVTYESIRQHMADPKQLPFIGDVRKGVDERLRRLGHQSGTIKRMRQPSKSLTLEDYVRMSMPAVRSWVRWFLEQKQHTR